MNLDSDMFDLDINNYTINDLQDFFNLKEKYKENDIIESSKIVKLRLSNHSDTFFKDKMYIFIKEAEKQLLEHISKNKIIPAGATYIIDEKNTPITNYVSQVYPTNVASGLINPLKKKTITNTFAINTLFRDIESKTSTDCVINLPYTIKDIISMQVVSVELPKVIYLINEGFNVIYFNELTTNINGTVIFPEGNYDIASLEIMMTYEINSQLETDNRFSVYIDPVTFKTTISNNTYNFNMKISNQNISNSLYLYKSLGWTLGYRTNNTYENKNAYISESLFNPCPTDYLFLEINDYNYSSASKLIGLFLDNFLDKNIITKIPYNSCDCSSSCSNKLFINKNNLISSVRNYFGPIPLQKLGIRLLNQYGETVNLHNMNFSFTLEMEVLYDL
jgi:hypothetical protein